MHECVCIYVCRQKCISLYMSVCTYVCMHSMYVCMKHICMYACRYTSTCMCIGKHAQLYRYGVINRSISM